MCWKGTRRISCFHHYTWVGSTCSIVCACTDYGSSVFRLMISWLSVKSCLLRMWTIHHLHYWTGFLSCDNFLTRCPVNFCWEPLFMFSKIVCYVFFVQLILTVTVKYTLMSIRSKFPLITMYLYWTGCALSLWGFNLSLADKLGETGCFFHSPKLNQTASLCLENVSNMFVSELIVFC